MLPGLGIYILNLGIGFLSPAADPSADGTGLRFVSPPPRSVSVTWACVCAHVSDCCAKETIPARGVLTWGGIRLLEGVVCVREREPESMPMTMPTVVALVGFCAMAVCVNMNICLLVCVCACACARL